jgi:hypothetical protein
LFGSFRYLLDAEHTLGERSAHDHAAHAGGGIEVLLARLAARAVEVGVDLGHRAGVVDVGGWMVGIVVVAGSSREVRAQSSKLLLNLRCSASVDRSFAEATRLGKGCMKVGLADGSGSKGSLKLMIVSLHVVVEVRESAFMLLVRYERAFRYKKKTAITLNPLLN